MPAFYYADLYTVAIQSQTKFLLYETKNIVSNRILAICIIDGKLLSLIHI